jgi:alpha 1,6-mannosyltransferase
MVREALLRVHGLSALHGLPLGELAPTDFEVLNSSGPAARTDVVFSHMQRHEPSLRSTRDLSSLTAPTLPGEILPLPVDGFGMGQPHSQSTNDGTIPGTAMVKHLFRGSWRQSHRDERVS